MKKTLLFLAAVLTIGFAANAQVAFHENFNEWADGTVPTGWVTYGDNLTNYYNDFSNTWEAYQQMMICITWTLESASVDRWLVTPSINVPSTNPMLVFDVLGVNYGPDSPFAESLKIMVSTTDNQKASFSVLEDLGELAAGESQIAVNLSNYAGQNVYLAFACYTADGMYFFLDNVEVKTMHANALSLVEVTAQNYSPMGQTFPVNVTVKNEGFNPLTAFEITYNMDNGTDENISVSGINVATFGTYTYTINANAPAQPSTPTVYVAVSEPNGYDDPDDTDNDGSASTTVYDPSMTTERTSLLEHFTTAVCQYCPSGHERLEAAIPAYESRIAWVAHHTGYYTDDLTIPESETITALYGADGTWAPAKSLDRKHEFCLDEVGVVGSVSDVATLQQEFAAALASPAFATIGITDLTYDPQTRELNFTVQGQFVSAFTGAQPSLTVILTEDSIIMRQQSTGSVIQQYQHNHVARKFLTSAWGDDDAFGTTGAGDGYSQDFTFTLPTNLRANKCRLVAFISNYGPTILQREVMNATKSDFLMTGDDPTNVGITSTEASVNVRTYPNPATAMAYVNAESTIRGFEMVNTLGQKVMSSENVNVDVLEINVSDLAAGVYYIKVFTDKGVATESISVVK